MKLHKFHHSHATIVLLGNTQARPLLLVPIAVRGHIPLVALVVVPIAVQGHIPLVALVVVVLAMQGHIPLVALVVVVLAVQGHIPLVALVVVPIAVQGHIPLVALVVVQIVPLGATSRTLALAAATFVLLESTVQNPVELQLVQILAIRGHIPRVALVVVQVVPLGAGSRTLALVVVMPVLLESMAQPAAKRQNRVVVQILAVQEHIPILAPRHVHNAKLDATIMAMAPPHARPVLLENTAIKQGKR
jgi:hypothetical protein